MSTKNHKNGHRNLSSSSDNSSSSHNSKKHRRSYSDTTTDFTRCSSDFTDNTDQTDCSDFTKCSNSNSSESRCRKNKCGLKFSDNPVGIWNLLFDYDGTGIENRPSQLVLNGDGTFTNFASPDLNNNPFPVLLTPGVGIWTDDKENTIKLQGTHIGYKPEDGKPEVYYASHIKMKLSRKGTKLRFHGKAVPHDINDLRLCSESNLDTICFTGCGVKLFSPQ